MRLTTGTTSAISSQYYKHYKSVVEDIHSDRSCCSLSQQDFRVNKQNNKDFVPVEMDLYINREKKQIETNIHDAFLRYKSDNISRPQRVLSQSAGNPQKFLKDYSNGRMYLRFMAHLMRDYQKYLRPITSRPLSEHDTDVSKLFDKEAFLRSRDKNATDFYRRLKHFHAEEQYSICTQ